MQIKTVSKSIELNPTTNGLINELIVNSIRNRAADSELPGNTSYFGY